ncbi:hypothetical protein RhiirA1_482713 [Rhizophagus irregularis]|uniref:Uncharacterized protein n=1 Tax=Rhizophagus irregularis TaxID=588596 RepID=A0A2N0QLH4_9GLOM|nr:hypothetical protein RhiirA1_482713 [Rhizophagus irregularis]
MSPDVENIREHFLKLNTRNFNQIVNYVNNINENSNLLKIYSFIKKLNYFPLNVLYSHIANLAGNNENSLHLTIPIMFIPFNNNENQCYCCKKIYSETPLFKQKYCKECLQWYIKYATSNTDNIKTAIGNLDAYVCTTDTLFVILNMNQEIQILAFKGGVKIALKFYISNKLSQISELILKLEIVFLKIVDYAKNQFIKKIT